MQLPILILELVALWAVSSGLTQAVFDLTVLLFRSRTIGITIISILTFPGTVVHELAHLFTAEILGVHTGKLTLVPEGLDSEEVKTGSVMIAHSDPLRRYLIGLAPILFGLLCISALSYIFLAIVPGWGDWVVWGYIGIGYLLVAVSNSMFSSKEDLKGFIPFIIALAAVVAAAYIAGLRIGITGALLTFITTIVSSLVKSLGIVLAVNVIGLVAIKLLTLLVQRLTRRRIVHR